MTTNFAAKLDELDGTVRMLKAFDATGLAAGLDDGAGWHTLAVGLGGSAVAAQFLARCRDTLGLGTTNVQTPMEIALGASDLSTTDVWLFSAGANSADVVSAAHAAQQRRCRKLHIVTRGPSGAAATIVADAGGEVHVVPVASNRDGYLATHSLIAAVGSLLLASDVVAQDACGQGNLVQALRTRLAESRNLANRLAMAKLFATLHSSDTIMLLADPQLCPVSTLIDTSVWEASICAVQCTDFRNFAHGRHGWLHHRGNETLVLALTGVETREVWTPVADTLPASIRQVKIDLGDCGRLSNALGLVDGFTLIEAMGHAVDIDPAKPGYGEFGPAIFEDRSLATLVKKLPASVRHKRASMSRTDERGATPRLLLEHSLAHLERLAGASIGGFVSDYDGTLVSKSERYSPPRHEIIDELVRLDAAGILIGIATGRGSSAGKDLREVLPMSMHSKVLMGYYNGGYLAPLAVDIDLEPLPASPVIAEAAEWLRSREDLFVSPEFKVSNLQITINMETLRHPYRFQRDLAECPLVRLNRIKVIKSGHSFDIVVSSASKLIVVEAVQRTIGLGKEVLCVGDSGYWSGNDHALLAHAYSISVGDVCGSPNGCWSLFGEHVTGPDALARVLRALLPLPSGSGVWLDVDSMGLDTDQQNTP